MSLSDVQELSEENAHQRRRIGRFYVVMSALLLLFTLAGFSRTLYLRRAFGLPELPAHLYSHGGALTAWFVLALLQACLIRLGHPNVHRAVGIVGIFLAIAVVVTGVSTLVLFSIRNEFPELEPALVSGNLSSLIAFSVCATSGVFLRRKPDAHKRLMLLASIAIVAPALDRLARLPALRDHLVPIFGGFSVPFYLVFAAVGLLFLLVVFLVFDIVTRGRIHRATRWGMAWIVLAGQILGAAIGRGGLWTRFVALFA